MLHIKLLAVAMNDFQDKPTPERKQGLLDQMTAYAYAVDRGDIEVPKVWRSS
jgi:hypothetical protein